MNFFRRRAFSGLPVLLCIFTCLLVAMPFPGSVKPVCAASGPDLAIQSFTFSPQTPAIGYQVTFSVTVINRGDSPAGNSRLQLFIDGDIVDSAYTSQIAAGLTASFTFTWKAKAGQHIARIVIDSEGSVNETDENNNEQTCAFSVLAPDLVIEDISWTPENPSSGEMVHYRITVKNQGNKLANGSRVSFFVDGLLRANRDIDALGAGDETVVTCSLISLPGLHNIEAFADALNQVKESDETNNTLAVNYVSAMPDLIINNITWSPAARTESSNVTINVSVKNTGSGNAGYSTLVLYVDDMYLASDIVGGLNAGTVATKTFSCALNANSHRLKAIIDASAMVTESDETNNHLTVTVPALACDFVIQSITWSPAEPVISHMVYFTVTVKNQGACQSRACEVKLYISELSSYCSWIGPLSPGESGAVTFPWVAKSESLSVRAVVDEDNIIFESNESNNTAAANIGFSQPVPTADLTIQSLTCVPATPSAGENVVVTAIVKNQGPGVASPSHAACYVDDDLLGYIYIPELGSEEFAEKSIIWSAVSGEHYIKVVADINNSVFETNESNNEKITSLVTTAPDLIIEKIEWYPLNPVTGNEVLFTLTIKNRGNKASSSCYITYYVDGSTQGSHYLDGLEPGAYTTRNFSWNMQAAEQTFWMVLDVADVVKESNETNNEKTIVLPAPDLTVQSVTCLEDYPTANTTLSFTASIHNIGMSPAGGVRVTGYIDGTPLSIEEVGVISAGGVVESVFTWVAVPGKHVLRITADGTGAITESDESNNTKEVIVFVPLPSSHIIDDTETVEETPENTAPDTTPEPESPVETVAPEVPPELIDAMRESAEDETVPDISGNLSDMEESSGGITGLLTNKWLMFGIAGVGIVAIILLYMMAKRSNKPKTTKPATPSKPAASKQAVTPAKPGAAPARPADTSTAARIAPPPSPQAPPAAAPPEPTPPPRQPPPPLKLD